MEKKAEKREIDYSKFKNLESLLIVCTGNTCRSPMAAAIGRRILPEVDILSAGTATVTGLSASTGAMDAMDSIGLSIDDHYSRPLSKYLLADAQLVLTMTEVQKADILEYMPEVQGKVFTLGEFASAGEEIPDPFGLSLEKYKLCAKVLEMLMLKVGEKCGFKLDEGISL